MPDSKPDLRELGFYYALAQIGLEMVAPAGIGYGIDTYFGWLPWATIFGAVFGFFGGLLHLLLMVKRHDEQASRQRDERP
jgi:F0F1-type ATP synthase assembly protein I